jgi:hypothetical protein
MAFSAKFKFRQTRDTGVGYVIRTSAPTRRHGVALPGVFDGAALEDSVEPL